MVKFFTKTSKIYNYLKNSNIANKPTYKQLVNKKTRGKYYDIYTKLKFKENDIAKIKHSINQLIDKIDTYKNVKMVKSHTHIIRQHN